MSIITVTGNGQISYNILKDYHFSAEAIHEIRANQSLPMEEEWNYEIDIEAESTQEAKDIFLTYIKKLNELGVASHTGHLIYITQSILKFEGNYINEEAILNKPIHEHLVNLRKLLTLQTEGTNGLYIEFKHNSSGNVDFANHTKIDNPSVLASVIEASIKALFVVIKEESQSHSVLLWNAIKSIKTPNIKEVDHLIAITSGVKGNTFQSHLLYTICATLHSYLNEWSVLNPNKVFLTNDQIRVIYHTCKIHNLLNVIHDIEEEAINYIRMLITNKKGKAIMKGTISKTIT